MSEEFDGTSSIEGKTNDIGQLWQAALKTLEGRIKPHNFEMWIRPVTCEGMADNRLRLSAPSTWIRDWFQDNYQSTVLEALRSLAPTDVDFEPEIEFEIRPDLDAEADALGPESARTGRDAAASAPTSAGADGAARAQGAGHGQDRGERSEGDLLDKYTFSTFVVGPSNQLAEAASRAVAEIPGGKYNPLFIYGGVGLGKTHLIQAIGHAIREKNPGWRILYIKTEAFMNEYINSLRIGKIDEFRRKYRDRCDVLLMDDIQFLSKKERTQDEFFHTFNSLFESHKQIVVTADKYPHEIPDLEERLRSRFQWGLIADIHPPELETRIAILKKKAEVDHIDLPDAVAVYLATNIRSNVRELEGLLIRVAAFAGLQEQPITIEFAQDTLRNFLVQTAHSLTVEAVQKEVAAYFNVKLQDMKSHKRHQAIARPRQIAMYLARKLCKASFPELGQRFGGKDHTTVLSACRKIEKLVETDAKTRHTVEEIERHLSS